MAARNVLVVALEEAPEEEIREAVRRRAAGDDVTVHVVAPAGDVGVLQWLTGAEDDVRAEAAERAAHAVDALEGETETEVEVGPCPSHASTRPLRTAVRTARRLRRPPRARWHAGAHRGRRCSCSASSGSSSSARSR